MLGEDDCQTGEARREHDHCAWCAGENRDWVAVHGDVSWGTWRERAEEQADALLRMTQVEMQRTLGTDDRALDAHRTARKVLRIDPRQLTPAVQGGDLEVAADHAPVEVGRPVQAH